MVSKKIKNIRLKKKLYQTDFAKMLNVDQGTMSKIERGILFPNFLVLKALKNICSKKTFLSLFMDEGE